MGAASAKPTENAVTTMRMANIVMKNPESGGTVAALGKASPSQ
jgi:hypothetical protein